MSRVGWPKRVAAVLVLAATAACGSPDVLELAEDSPPSESAAFPDNEPSVSALASSTPERDTTASVSSVSVPSVSVPTTSVPSVSVPSVSVSTTSVPSVSVPSVSVPSVSVPTTSVPSVSLPVATENDAGYDRDDWGPHNSGICRGAVGSPDPYTATPIETCNVDHVVALHEAHESGGWAWPEDAKQRFSQDPDNHVASRACVNQSKGGDDISEWSDADITSSSACGGGYAVTAAGRCFLALTTVAVKSAWGLAVDQAEADALSRTLARCGDQAPEFAAVPQDVPTTTVPTTTVAPPTTTVPTTTVAPPTTTVPTTTVAPPTTTVPTTTVAPPTTVAEPDECVIAGKTAAEYDAVPGIGEVLSARLVDAQPYSSRSQLEAVRGIGPVRAEAVWSHFCGP